jgi:GTP-binding protein Era
MTAPRPGRSRASSAHAQFRSGYAAIVGHTNVGKSTLLNRLVGEKIAIVANVAQTTRSRITGILTEPRGQVVFVDTPGFHRPEHRMNRAMVEIATDAMSGVDVLLWVVDATAPFGPGDRRVARLIGERKGAAAVFLVLNKVDLVRKPQLLPLLDRAVKEFRIDEAYPLSAKSGDNCANLLDGIFKVLPIGPKLFPDDALTDQPERVMVSEIIREKLLHKTREEIPHATAVLIDRWEDGADNVTRIDAVILVEREGQKGIVIGSGGDMLKMVGTEARLEAEKLLGRRVGLKLWVKVRDRWRDDEATLRSLGLT